MTTELKKYKRIFYRLSLHVKLYIHKFQREKDLFITLSIVYTLFFFYKNIFYKNIEAEICEILGRF